MTASQEPRRHHYIPQWYLRQFGTRDSVAVYDKWTRNVTLHHPRDVAFGVGFYDIDHPVLPRTTFETVLGNVENHAANAARRLATQGLASLTPSQREDIAAFVVTLQVRVPSARRAVEAHLLAKLDGIRAALPDDALREIAGYDLSTAELELIRQPSSVAALPSGVMAYGVSLALSTFVDQLIDEYEWSLVDVEPANLITCDTPVKVLTDRAEDRTTYLAEVPIDRSHVLILRSGDGGPLLKSVGGKDQWHLNDAGRPSLELFQKFAMLKAERYLFGHPENPLWDEIALSGPSNAMDEVPSRGATLDAGPGERVQDRRARGSGGGEP